MKDSTMPNRIGLRDESGVTIVVVTFFVVALFAFAALSLDVGNVLREQRKAQIGTDAAALAAVTMLGTSTDDATLRAAVNQMANQIAGTNGVTATEIASGNGGGIQLGYWSNATFYVRASAPYNAVRVPARRTVNLMFGRVVGLGQMRPAVESVAKITLGGMVPFGVGQDVLSGVATNCANPKDNACQFTINRANSGNWGKLDLGGVLNNPNAWEDAFVNGYDGPVGQNGTLDGEPVVFVDTDPGFAKLKEAWDLRRQTNPFVVLPVAIQFFNGRKTVTIIQYASVELLDQNGNGNGWKGNLRLLGITTTPPTFQLANQRELVR